VDRPVVRKQSAALIPAKSIRELSLWIRKACSRRWRHATSDRRSRSAWTRLIGPEQKSRAGHPNEVDHQSEDPDGGQSSEEHHPEATTRQPDEVLVIVLAEGRHVRVSVRIRIQVRLNQSSAALGAVDESTVTPTAHAIDETTELTLHLARHEDA
jgi:hypothetical protein